VRNSLLAKEFRAED